MNRQSEDKTRANFARGGFHANTSLVGFNDTTTDGQTEATTAQIQPVKRFENAFAFTRGYCCAAIDDFRAQILQRSYKSVLIGNIQGYQYLRVSWTVTEGVFNQIIEDALKLHMISIDEW